MTTKKELRELFTSFKGLKTLKNIVEEKSCARVSCDKCPLGKRNTLMDCTSIVYLHEISHEEAAIMKKLIEIFTEEKISRTLSLIDKRLKYNSRVVYNGKSYIIKGVIKKKVIGKWKVPILLNGLGDNYDEVYDDCIIKESDMKKGYTLWVDVKNIEILEK